MFKYLLKLLGIPTDKPTLKYDHSYLDSDGWYVMKPKGWKIGMKMSPDHNTIRVDMKSLREHVFGGKDE
ncbi:hypothetical protein VPHF99_0274 [Vibrio phage F99]